MSKKIRSSMTSFVAYVGVGKAGCKIADSFRKLGYSAYFINTSAKDLNTIDAPKNIKYQIPLAQGTNSNRTLAKKYCKDYFDLIMNNIESKLSNFTHIFFCFSSGGGTGSGITPLLVKNLITRIQDTKFGMICALPSENESPRAKYNTWECSNEIKKIEGLGNIYLMNNNFSLMNDKGNDFDIINNLLAMRMNDTLSIVDYDNTGNIDESEMRATLDIYGCTTFAEINIDNTNNKIIKSDSFMVDLKKGCQFILYSLTDNSNFIQSQVDERFGLPLDYRKCEGSSNFVTVFGLPYPDEFVNELAKDYQKDREIIDNIEDDAIETIDLGEFINPFEQRRKNLAVANEISKMLDDLEDF